MGRGNQIQLTASGSTANLEQFLKMAGRNDEIRRIITPIAESGLQRLKAATPRDTGLTAESWSYEIVINGDGIAIYWKNSNMNHGRHIAILIRYGHGTRNGGYVPANDFITPVMRPIFEQIKNEVWKAVTRSG